MKVTRENVATELERLLTERFSVPAQDINPEAHFFDNLGLDSVDLLSAMAILEERHGVSIPDDDLPEMLVFEQCVDRLMKYMETA